MNFKIHLLIISILIIASFGIIQLIMGHKEEQQQITAAAVASPYTINIERASWGLNCLAYTKNKNTDNYMQPDPANTKLKENNVLSAVSRLCNVKSKCDIPIDPNVLGEDPAPSCGYKVLQVEYRCFNIDRLRSEKASEGVISIDCDKNLSNQ